MRVLFATLFIVITDQLTKFLVKGGTIPLLNIRAEGMQYGQSIKVFGDFFKLTFVENPGIAFGIDVNESSKLVLSIFTLIASIGIFYYLWKSREQKLIVRLALAFILGGAIGNLIDRTFYGVFYGYERLFYGHVVDFFNMDFFDFTIFGRTYERWPIFNIADASVSIGVVLLLFFHKSPVEKSIEGSDTVVLTEESVEDKSAKQTEAIETEISNSSLSDDGKDSNREENKS
ncbi:MAG: signal peptidase II [Ignavibacteriales bacterium]|nr:signal peptidase II [Ignavibacteriales bacterium]